MPQLKDRVLYRINAYLIVVAALALPIALYLFMYREGRMGTGMFVWLVVLFLTVAVWLFRSAFKLQPFSFLMGIVALFAVAELFVMPYIGSFVSNSDPKSISATRENPNCNLYCFTTVKTKCCASNWYTKHIKDRGHGFKQ